MKCWVVCLCEACVLECSLVQAFLSAGRHACLRMCLAYVHMAMDCTIHIYALMCRPSWVVLSGLHLCEDANRMQM